MRTDTMLIVMLFLSPFIGTGIYILADIFSVKLREKIRLWKEFQWYLEVRKAYEEQRIDAQEFFEKDYWLDD